MPGKIVLFLSELKPKAKSAHYRYKGKHPSIRFSGMQTNEAPVKWLLSLHPEIAQIICICSEKGKRCITLKGNTAEQSALERLQSSIAAFCDEQHRSEVPFHIVDYEPSSSLEQDLLPKLLRPELLAPGDHIYFDVTGGLRLDSVHLLLISRVLSYAGVEISGAVYSNYDEKQVEDVSHLFRMLDLLEGVQNLTSFGSVKHLRSYYGSSPETPINDLLCSMERLIEHITLCRVNAILGESGTDDISRFNTALQNAEHCHDPLLRQLLPTFQKKYCSSGQRTMTLPGLIQWCLDNDMLQQALTLFTECIPAYIVSQDWLTIGALEQDVQIKVHEKQESSHQDQMTILFDTDLLMRGRRLQSSKLSAPYCRTIEHLHNALRGTPYHLNCSISKMQTLLRDYIYLKMVRNMINHANDRNAPDRIKQETYLVQEHHYPPVGGITARKLHSTLTAALKHLNQLG